jgi:hypothetical protein
MACVKDRYGWIAKGRLAAMEARQRQANAKATELEPVIAEIRAAGVTTPYGIAKALNARGVPTVKGKAQWRELGVKRVLARLSKLLRGALNSRAKAASEAHGQLQDAEVDQTGGNALGDACDHGVLPLRQSPAS